MTLAARSHHFRSHLRRVPLVAALLLATALVACTDGAEDDAAPGTPEEPDEAFDVDGAFAEDPDCFGIELDGLEPDDVACGTVTAPLDHDDPGGETITLAVATLTPQDASGDPILVLGGGPGEVVVENALTEPTVRQLFASADREVILLDQRGVGSSEPALICPDLDDADVTDLPDPEEQRQELLACREGLVEAGVDLDAFNHVNNARDVDLVRRALGYDQIVLRGGSYGSHLALHAAALAPDGFSALVLSSPADPGNNYLERFSGGFQAALDRIDEGCAADERCSEQLGEVHTTIEEIAARLSDEPEEVTAEPLTGGEPITRTFNGEVFIESVFALFYAPDGPLALPSLLLDAREGDLEPLAGLLATIEAGLEDIPQGMNLSMVCSGEGAFFDAEVAREELRSPVLEELWFDRPSVGGADTTEVCDLWDVEPSFDPGDLDLAIDIPTLLFTGELDHVTPPEVGEELAEQLPNSQLVPVRSLGHGPLEGLDALAAGCGSRIVSAFLDDPDGELNTICTQQIPPIDAVGQFMP